MYNQSQVCRSWYEGTHTAVTITKPLAIGNCNKLHTTCKTNLHNSMLNVGLIKCVIIKFLSLQYTHYFATKYMSYGVVTHFVTQLAINIYHE